MDNTLDTSPEGTAMLQVLLATDQPVLARGLLHVLAADRFEMRTVSNNLDTITDAITLGNPDVVLLDFTPEEHFAMLLELRQRVPHCRAVLWVRNLSTEVAFQVMKLGVRGILRTTLEDKLVPKCLRLVATGELWFDKALTHAFLTARTVALTPRESQLVSLVTAGLKNKEIATTLSISNATVRIYLSALFRKLKVKDRYELAIYGMKNMALQQPSVDSSDDRAMSPGASRTVPLEVRFLMMQDWPADSAPALNPRCA